MNGYISFGWAPDGSSVLELAAEDTKRLEVVPLGAGSSNSPDWPVFSALSWQRLAAD
jgi:hypothetical protein